MGTILSLENITVIHLTVKGQVGKCFTSRSFANTMSRTLHYPLKWRGYLYTSLAMHFKQK